ncbi:unnamed protein product [Lactuca virosa]|uniref:O-methyltransferase C-terminal domain-containing protein n=1 Tax=Lactuca virosa TaxID=75947 RepID=A0AAU9PAY4_9ASTR|nr:unnamed protein product [Lactuca virosa]
MAKTPNAQFSSLDLASSLPTRKPDTPDLTERILRFLASQSILTSTLVTDESDAVANGGIPFNRAHGVHAFEYPAKDNRFNQVFNKCMYDNTTIVMKMFLGKYKGFEGVKQLVDVGGGLGANLDHIIVSKNPNIKGINFDLPHVIKDATSSLGVGGDMFESIPTGDWILHDWGDNECITVLKNCWAALPESGKVVAVEAIIPDLENQPSDHTTNIDIDVSKAVISSDMIMMIANPGGKERTLKEYNTLAKKAGFASLKIVCRVSTFCVEKLPPKLASGK